MATGWYEDGSTRHVWHSYLATYDGEVVHQAEEVAWGTWMTVDDLRAHLADPTWPFVPDGRELVEHLLATGGSPGDLMPTGTGRCWRRCRSTGRPRCPACPG